MPNRPDLRDIASNVRDAFSAMDRDALLDILTFVVKEYVVEGPPPMLVHQAETLGDLTPANFGQLISALQTRFDFPELAMFIVEEDRVGVRIGGVVHTILAQRAPLTGPAADSVIDTRPAAGRNAPGVRVVETELQQRPRVAPSNPPPPTRGVSVRGRPNQPDGEPLRDPSAAAGQVPVSAPATSAASAGAAPAASAATPGTSDKPEKSEGSGDDASARFSLLELD